MTGPPPSCATSGVWHVRDRFLPRRGPRAPSLGPLPEAHAPAPPSATSCTGERGRSSGLMEAPILAGEADDTITINLRWT